MRQRREPYNRADMIERRSYGLAAYCRAENTYGNFI
jgi:hypothetical protein